MTSESCQEKYIELFGVSYNIISSSERGWSRSLSPHPMKNTRDMSLDSCNGTIPNLNQTTATIYHSAVLSNERNPNNVAQIPRMSQSQWESTPTTSNSANQASSETTSSRRADLTEDLPPPLPPRQNDTIHLSCPGKPSAKLCSSMSLRVKGAEDQKVQNEKISDFIASTNPPLKISSSELCPPSSHTAPSPMTAKRSSPLEPRPSSCNPMKMEIRGVGCLQGHSSSHLDLAEPLPPGLFNSPRHVPENPDNTRVMSEGPDKHKVKVKRAEAEQVVETRDTDTQTEDEERFLHKARSILLDLFCIY